MHSNPGPMPSEPLPAADTIDVCGPEALNDPDEVRGDTGFWSGGGPREDSNGPDEVRAPKRMMAW